MSVRREAEFETKLVATAEAVEAVRHLDEIAGWTVVSRGCKERQDVYFDTDDWRLLSVKTSFRYRIRDSDAVVTLKRPLGRGVLERDELEEDIAVDDTANVLRLDIEPVRQLRAVLGLQATGRLSEKLWMRSTRWFSRLGRGPNAEPEMFVMADAVVYEAADGRQVPYWEIEVERLTGSESDVLVVNDWIAKRYDLRESEMSKFERGVALTPLDDVS